MKKIGQPYLDQGKMWQDVEFEPGDKVPEGNQFFDPYSGWAKNLSYEKWTQKEPSCFKRRIPVENKVQENAKKNLHLLREMLLHEAKIVQKDGDCVRIVNYPTQLLKDGEFFVVSGETHEWLQKDQIGPDKYAIFEALAEGKPIQFKAYESTDWDDFTPFSANCHFDGVNHLYRVKPEEIPDTTIKWTSVTEPPECCRAILILHNSGTIQTIYSFGGQFMDTGIKGWSYVNLSSKKV